MRVIIVVAAVLLTIWQGGCLTWFDGTLVNRCGLWQWGTGRPIVIATKAPIAQVLVEREKIIERIIEKRIDPPPQPVQPPIVVYRDAPSARPTAITSGAVIMFGQADCYATSTMTITAMAIPMNCHLGR